MRIVVSSYANGRELYRGDNMKEAQCVADALKDKHTFYIFDGNTIRMERRYGNGDLDSIENIRVSAWELEHLKTLVSIIS